MNIQYKKSIQSIMGAVIALFLLVSCTDLVENGYTIDYGESDAELKVEAIDGYAAAFGEIISFKIEVKSNEEIKSCIVQATKPGDGGSGYDVSTEGFDDPFADHNYGTMKKGVKSFTIKYDYVVPADVNSSKITFTVVEEATKVSQSVEIETIPAIKTYKNIELVAKNNIYNDAFATINGSVYHDIITNYSTISEQNRDVQEKIDIMFFVQDGNSVIASPAYVNLGLSIKNKTLFKILPNISSEDFENLTAASLIDFTKNDSINYYGHDAIGDIKVGDIIGFSTDLNALHALKTGLIKVNQLHPTSVDRYEGRSYVMKCDILTQIEQ